jgi:hypothetical protein
LYYFFIAKFLNCGKLVSNLEAGMDPSSVASAYLSSLIHSPGSHFISLEYRPSQQLTRSDLSVWMEGFRCAYTGDRAKLPANDEVFVWVDVALKRYFEWEEQCVEVEQVRARAAAAQASTVNEQINVPVIGPEQSMAQGAGAETSPITERKKSPRSLSVPSLKFGFAAR